jgi:hypothetical protein
MSAELHGFHPEEVMAYLDGEITGERALALADHLQQCAECSALADDFCSLSQQLIAWKIEPSPLVDSLAILGVEALTAEEAMGAFKFDKESIAAFPHPQESAAPAVGGKSSFLPSFLDFIWRPRIQHPWVWALGSACAVLLVVSSLSFRMSKVAPSQSKPTGGIYQGKTQNPRANTVRVEGADAADNSVNGARNTVTAEDLQAFNHEPKANERKIDNLPINGRNHIDFTKTDSQVSREPARKIEGLDTSVHSELATKVTGLDTAVSVEVLGMIERTASLSITVKEMDAARAAIEDIEKRHHGYFADLNTEGQSEAGRTLTASLRVPADELDATLIELRKLGHLDEEKQGGDEVTQQHVDLQARLKNARNTERRLTDLLTKRADKLKDVLDVERELASTREEIERMEAQLRNMENQVSYAAIDLKLREEYKPALNLAPPATGTRLRNALVDGYKSAVESALGLVLFLFQEGPTILFWLLLLFFPARWTWRKLRALAAQKQSLAGAL